LYDYGDSTYVTLRVVSEREGVIRDEEDPVELLALNVPPDISCVICGKPATQIVADHYGAMEQTYCDECAKNHDNKEEEEEEGEIYWVGDEAQIIEIVNSPRIGIGS
jgi:hypothetical protein